jgi:hypothetical protein
MKVFVGAMLLLGVTQTLCCSAPREAAFSPSPAITLGDRDGRMQLTLRDVEMPGRKGRAAVLALRAHGEGLLAGEPGATPNVLWLDGRPLPAGTNSIRVLDRVSSNEWTYAVADMMSSMPGSLKSFKRHLLFVEPDLFVVCDEIDLETPHVVESGWCFPGGTRRDPVREEWRLQRAEAGLTARLLGSPKAAERLWADDSSPAPTAPVPGANCVRFGTTNRTAHFHGFTMLVPHEKEARRSLTFKLLESESAIGVRVHRDGLPTLLAIRRNGVVGEANLTGMKFSGPAAVDVFRPRRK